MQARMPARLAKLCFVRCVHLKRAQFDVKKICSQLEEYAASLRNRGLAGTEDAVKQLYELPTLYEKARGYDAEVMKVQSKRKALEKEIKLGKVQLPAQQQQLLKLKRQFQELTLAQKNTKASIYEVCVSLPNLVALDAPLDAPVVLDWINPRAEYVADPSRDHREIMLRKGMVDFTKASEVTGSSWYYLLNEGALLEHALVNYVSRKARNWGFKMCLPPSIARQEVIDACGFRPNDQNDEKQIYNIEESSLGLTATAEIPLAGLGLNKVLDLTDPIAVFGVNRCYRAEAGAHGKETRGLYRVHEFTKVELFYWARPSCSNALHERLRAFQTEVVEELGLTAKVLNMPINDLGFPAYKKYDIEVWMPGKGSFGEVSSASNCTDFQSRRLSTKFTNTDNKLEYAHTLNGTALAVPRMILAIVENFYDPESGLIHIPTVLQQYMDGLEYI